MLLLRHLLTVFGVFGGLGDQLTNLLTLNLRRSWEGERGRNKMSVIEKEMKHILEQLFFRFGSTFCHYYCTRTQVDDDYFAFS